LKKVYVTRKINEKAVEYLRKQFEVEVNMEERQLSKKELIEKARDCDALLSLLSDNIDAEVVEECNKLKIIANYAVGYNNIDLKAAKEKNIVVTNTPDVLTAATADLAFALIFSVARRIVEGDKYVRAGSFKMWSPTLLLGQDISGKTIGIIGAGRIGQAIAKRSSGFDMKILYHNRNRDCKFEEETGAAFVNLEQLLTEADYVSVNVPLSNDTFHMLGEREFGLMKSSSILINTSRGPVVDEVALVKALKAGDIWGAGLDVYEREPEIEKELLCMDNVVLLPHIGSATIDTRYNMAMLAVQNIEAVLNGNDAINKVN
jgi:glyoxylate reductase